jgi:glycerophosphoryl diester phosphodiesterase
MTCRILAHRGNTAGPRPDCENRLPAIEAALARGFGLELDIRRTRDGRFYISHDPAAPGDALSADDALAACRRHPQAMLAINIKECGYEDALLAFLTAQGVLTRSFLFDMELVEPRPGGMARRFRAASPAVRLAARVSDRGETVARALGIEAASVIWLDEFDGPWCTGADVRRLQDAGRQVYAVSPDLHRFSIARARARWLDFARWGVDGICTDYPDDLAGVFDEILQGVSA